MSDASVQKRIFLTTAIGTITSWLNGVINTDSGNRAAHGIEREGERLMPWADILYARRRLDVLLVCRQIVRQTGKYGSSDAIKLPHFLVQSGSESPVAHILLHLVTVTISITRVKIGELGREKWVFNSHVKGDTCLNQGLREHACRPWIGKGCIIIRV